LGDGVKLCDSKRQNGTHEHKFETLPGVGGPSAQRPADAASDPPPGTVSTLTSLIASQ